MRSEDFLTRNIASFTGTLESVIVAEDMARGPGLLQSLDPRVKIVTFLLMIILVGLARSLPVLAGIFVLIIAVTLLSKIRLGFFLKRVLLFVPFTAIIAIPALFITPGVPLLHVAGRTIITEQGVRTAGFLLSRVTDSISFGMLLIITTPWMDLLSALRSLRVPSLLVAILNMTYRYIFVLLQTVNAMLLARRSRTIGRFSGGENRRWLVSSMATTMTKSQHLSEEVYLAMLSRGYQGEVRTLSNFRLRRRDFLWGTFALMTALVFFWGNHQ